jgi:hypothetical protein
METENWIVIGQVSIESGQLLIGDPWNLEDGLLVMKKCCNATQTERGCGQVVDCGVAKELGFVFTNSWGDGTFNVEAVINEENRIEKIRIDFTKPVTLRRR